MSLQEALYNSETKRVRASCHGVSSEFYPPVAKGQRNVLRGLMDRKKTWRLRKERQKEKETEWGWQSPVWLEPWEKWRQRRWLGYTEQELVSFFKVVSDIFESFDLSWWSKCWLDSVTAIEYCHHTCLEWCHVSLSSIWIPPGTIFPMKIVSIRD